MFTPSTAPFGNDPATVTASLFLPPVSSSTIDSKLNVFLVFYNEESYSQVGQPSAPSGTLFCCTAGVFGKGGCPSGTKAGDLILMPRVNPTDVTPTVASFSVSPALGARVASNFTVPTSSPVYFTVVVCESSGGPLPVGAPVEITTAFRNPYGYLPGTLVGLLPWYAVLFALYALLALAYIGAMICNRSYVLPLQWLVLSVIGLGLLEMVVNLGTYAGKNITGVPTPCNICVLTSDYMTGVVLNVGELFLDLHHAQHTHTHTACHHHRFIPLVQSPSTFPLHRTHTHTHTRTRTNKKSNAREVESFYSL